MPEKQSLARQDLCATCRFWQTWGDCPPLVDPVDWLPGGECRRNAPGRYTVERRVPLKDEWFTTRTVEVQFPPIGANGWCGEHEPIVERKSCLNGRVRWALSRLYRRFFHKCLSEYTWELFAQFSESQLAEIKGLGPVTKKKIMEQLAAHGLKLKGD